MENKQLFEKRSNSYNPFFPLVRLEDIIETISDKSIQWILNNYNHIYVEYSESTAITRNKVPALLRRSGLWITYNVNKEIITEYYKGDNKDVQNYLQWTMDDNWERFDKIKHLDGSITYQHLSEAVKQLLGSGNTITNYPDDEDLTVKGGTLKLKDRDYDVANFSGLGRIILRKNIMFTDKKLKNILTQDMIDKENTIYEIRYDFDLNGAEITVPEGCVLDFQGGSISAGSLIFGNTLIKGNVRLGENLKLKGSCINQEVRTDWYNMAADGEKSWTEQLNGLIAISNGTVKITKGIYRITGNNKRWTDGLLIKSNTTYVGDEATIIQDNSAHYVFCTHLIHDNIDILKNVVFKNIYFRGAVGFAAYSHIIQAESIDGLTITNCTFEKWKGDAILVGWKTENYTGKVKDSVSKNIFINNCIFDGGAEPQALNRQAISVCGTHTDNVHINNNVFQNIGHRDMPGVIDIELEGESYDNSDFYIGSIFIKNNIFKNFVGCAIRKTDFTRMEGESITIEGNTIYGDNETKGDYSILLGRFRHASITNNYLYNAYEQRKFISTESIKHCTIGSNVFVFEKEYSLTTFPFFFKNTDNILSTLIISNNTFKGIKNYFEGGGGMLRIDNIKMFLSENNIFYDCGNNFDNIFIPGIYVFVNNYNDVVGKLTGNIYNNKNPYRMGIPPNVVKTESISTVGDGNNISSVVRGDFYFKVNAKRKARWYNGEYWIDGVGNRITWPITYDLTNITSANLQQPEADEIHTTKIVANEGYSLPDTIEVYMGGRLLTHGVGYGAEYSYYQSNGNIYINGVYDAEGAHGVSGDIIIKAVANTI